MKTMYEFCSQRYDDNDFSLTHTFLIVVPPYCFLKGLIFRGTRKTPFVNVNSDICYIDSMGWL